MKVFDLFYSAYQNAQMFDVELAADILAEWQKLPDEIRCADYEDIEIKMRPDL